MKYKIKNLAEKFPRKLLVSLQRDEIFNEHIWAVETEFLLQNLDGNVGSALEQKFAFGVRSSPIRKLTSQGGSPTILPGLSLQFLKRVTER